MPLIIQHLVIAAAVFQVLGYDRVIDLKDSNFHDYVSSGFWLIDFYAPGCVHCKELAYVLDDLAIKTEDVLNIGKIDASRYTALADIYNVNNYPMLFYARDGSDLKPYVGSRSLEKLEAFAERMTGDAVHTISSEEEIASKLDKIYFLLCLRNEKDVNLPLVVAYKNAAREMQAEVDSFMTSSAQICTKYSNVFPFIVKIEQNVEDFILYKQTEIDYSDLPHWLIVNKWPLVVELGGTNYASISSNNQTLVIAMLLYKDKANVNLAKKELHRLASKHTTPLPSDQHSKYQFCYLDGLRWSGFANLYDIPEEKLPSFIVLNPKEEYFFSNASKLLPQDYEAYLTRVIEGKEDLKYDNWKGWFRKTINWFNQNQPLSSIAIGVFIFIMVATIYMIIVIWNIEEKEPESLLTTNQSNPGKGKLEKKKESKKNK